MRGRIVEESPLSPGILLLLDRIICETNRHIVLNIFWRFRFGEQAALSHVHLSKRETNVGGAGGEVHG